MQDCKQTCTKELNWAKDWQIAIELHSILWIALKYDFALQFIFIYCANFIRMLI